MMISAFVVKKKMETSNLNMNYTDYLKKAGIKQKKIKGLSYDSIRLKKLIPAEHGFRKMDLKKRENSAIL